MHGEHGQHGAEVCHPVQQLPVKAAVVYTALERHSSFSTAFSKKASTCQQYHRAFQDKLIAALTGLYCAFIVRLSLPPENGLRQSKATCRCKAIDSGGEQLTGPAVRCGWVGEMERRRTTPAPLTRPSSPQCPRSETACSRTLLRRPCCPEKAAGSRPGAPEVQRPLPEAWLELPSRAAAAAVAAGGLQACCLLVMLPGARPDGRCCNHVLQLACSAEALQDAGACCLEGWLRAAGHR